MTHATPSRAILSRLLRHLLPAALALATATCTNDNVGPSDTGMGYFTFRPVYRLAGGASLAQFGIVADSIHIRLTRPVAQPVLDTTVFFPPDSTSLRLALPVELQQSPETLTAVIEISAAGTIIFTDSVESEVKDGPPGSSTPPVVTFDYVGPGSNIASLTLLPPDTAVFFGDTLFFTATAIDSSDAAVASFYVGWKSSDTTVAKINANGRLIAPATRGSVRVIGMTPTGIADTTLVTFEPVPVIVTADSGNGQTGVVGDSLAALFVAQVKGADSLGIAGIPVKFAAVTAGGAVRDTFTLVTDAAGRVRTRGVLGTVTGAYSYTATAVGTGLAARTFAATALPGAPSAIAITGGNGQSVVVTNPLPLPLSVRITDAFGNPAPGAHVIFTRLTGSGTPALDTVATNASGVAAQPYTLGTVAGVDSIRAALQGTSAFVDFTATGTAGGAVSQIVISGDGQSALVGTPYALPLVVEVHDAVDNPVGAGTLVRWSAPVTNTGVVSADSTFTDSLGRASVTVTAGSLAGFMQVQVSSAGADLFFSLTNLPGAPTVIAIAGGNAQTDTIGQTLALPLQVHVTDGFSNNVPGTMIYWARTVGTGSVSQDSTLTDASGIAQITYTLGGTAGTDSITATIAGTSAFVALTATAVSAVPTQIIQQLGGGQSAIVAALFTDSLAVQILDLNDNPVGGVWVHWTDPTGAVTPSADSTLTDVNGHAAVAITAGTVAVATTVEATVAGIALPSVFNETVTAGAPSSMVIASGDGQTGASGSTLPLSAEVRITDLYSNPIAGVTVDFAVTAGGGSIDSATATTDSTGRANSGLWTLGAAGLNRVEATSTTFPGDTLRFDATATPAGTSKLWTAAVSNDWTVPGNWSPAGAPGIGDNIFVPASATSPVLNSGTTIGDLIIESGATFTVNAAFTASGNVDIGGTLAGSGSVTLTGSASTLRGKINNLVVTISGTRSLNGNATLLGALTVSSGSLTIAGHTLSVGNGLSISGTGLLVMTNAADSVDVFGPTTFSSTTSSTGSLTNGVLALRGNLTQTAGAFTNFSAGPNHRTRFIGGTLQSVSFSNPSPANSHFGTVDFANGVGVVFSTNMSATGPALVSNSGNVTGSGRTAFLANDLTSPTSQWLFATTEWSAAPTNYPDSVPGSVSVVTPWTLTKPFQIGGNLIVNSTGLLTVGGQALRVVGTLTVSGTGQLVMTNAADSVDIGGNAGFSSGTTSTGLLSAGVLVLRGDFNQTAGAATNFAPSGTHRTRFLGTIGQSVSFTTPGSASSRFQDVEFGDAAGVSIATTVTAMGTTKVSAGTVTGIGKTINLGGDLLTTYAQWQVSNTLWGASPTVYPDSLPRNVTVFNAFTLNKPFKVDSNVTINSTGILTLNGQTMRIGGSLTQGGILRMKNGADSLDVAKNVTVNSAVSGTAELQAGVLVIGGNFTQTAGANDNFAADSIHRVRFDGAATQTVTFGSPAAANSHFATVDFDNAAGITLNSDIVTLADAIVSKGVVTGAARTATIGTDLTAGNSAWVVATTSFTTTPTTFPGAFTGDVQFHNGATLTQDLATTGSITIFNGLLDLNGHAVTVGTAVSLTGGGQLHMVNALDSVDAGGFGVSTATSGQGHYTAGVIVIHDGNFVQAGDAKSFYASGTHRVKFDGSSPQTIFFVNPDTGASRFEGLEIKNTSTVTANSNFAVHGAVTVNDGAVLGAAKTAFLAGGGIFDTLGGRWNVGTTIFQEYPANLPAGLPGSVIFRASGSLSATLTVGGNLTVDEDTLYLGGHPLQVVGDLTVGGAGVLPMLSAGDTLLVTGNVVWSTSKSHAGLLTAGEFLVQKNFTQTLGAADNFAADTGLHLFIASSGTAPQLSFADPVASHFGALSVSSVNGVNLATDVSVAGTFAEGNGTPTNVFSGSQHTLRVGGLDVDGATFDRVNVEVHSDTNAIGFDNVTFLNQDVAVTQLSLELPGQTGDTIKLNSIAFSGTPTTGRYVYAADSVANDGVANIAFYNSTPLNGALFTGTEGSVGDLPNVLWSHLEWQVEPVAATEGLPIIPAPEVRAVDPSGVLLIGFTGQVTLQFSSDPTAGAASLTGNAVSAVSGVATFDALSISMSGTPFALSASAPGLGVSAPTSSFTVDLPLPSGTTTAFNNGGGDNDWDNPANWTFGVPDSADNVFVFAGQTANVNTPARANTVSIGAGGTLLLNAPLTVDSTVKAGNTIAGGGQLIAQGTGFLSGVVGGLVVTGSYLVPVSDTLTADFINISGASAVLDPGSARIVAIDSLRTEAGGRLDVNDVNAVVSVQGLARFTGGASALLAGTLEVGSDFSQEENVGAFSPGPSFVTLFNGGGTQTATFFSPDTSSDRFGVLGLTSGGTLHLAGAYVPILGNIDIQGGHVVVDTQAVVLGTITGATGAFMEGATLLIRDNFAFGGVYTVSNTIFIGTNQSIQQGVTPFDTVYVQGTAALAGNVTANAFFATGSGAQFDLAGHRLDVVGDFGTLQSGIFTMTDPADTVMVGGSFYASGGSTDGLLTAGLLQVAGNFIEGNYVPCCVEVIQSGPSPAFDAFRATGSHLTRLAGGSGTRIIYFATPVSATDPFSVNNSHFGNLELTDGTDTLLSTVPAAGDLVVVSASLTHDPESNGGLGVQGDATIGTGVTLFDLSNFAISGSIDFQPAPAVYTVGSTVFFGDGQTIPVLPYNDIEVVLGQATLGGDLSLQNVRTGISSEGPGFPGDLRLGGHTLTVNGSFTTTGLGTFTMDDPADSLDVSSGGMDLGGGVTTALTAGTLVLRGDLYMEDSNFVASGTHRTVFAAAGSQQLWITTAPDETGNQFNKLTIVAGATVNFNVFSAGPLVVKDTFAINGFFLQANPGKSVIALGDLYAGVAAGITVDYVELHKSLDIDASSYSVQLTRYAGAGQVISATTAYNDLEVTGTGATLDTTVTVNHDFAIHGGDFDPAGHTLSIAHDLLVDEDGLLKMGTAADSVNVGYTATFDGRDSEGWLTAGTLTFNYFKQLATTSPNAFRATGAHRAVLLQQNPADETEMVQFATPGAAASQFQEFELSGGSLYAYFGAGTIYVADSLYVPTGGSSGLFGSGTTMTVNGPIAVQTGTIPIQFDTLELRGSIQVPYSSFSNNVTRFAGVNQQIPDTQSYQRIEVTGTATLETGGGLVAASSAEIYGSGRLTLGANMTFISTGTFGTSGSGSVAMTDPSAALNIQGDAAFLGGSTEGLLSSGTMTLQGDLNELGATSDSAFRPSLFGGFELQFDGDRRHSITMGTQFDVKSYLTKTVVTANDTLDINDTPIPFFGRLDLLGNAALVNSGAGQPFVEVLAPFSAAPGALVQLINLGFRDTVTVDPSATYDVGTTYFGYYALPVPVLPYQSIHFQGGTPFLGTDITATGWVTVNGQGGSADLRLNGLTLHAGNFETIQGGTLTMDQAADILTIDSTAHFRGGSEIGKLVAGGMVIGGDFKQDTAFGNSPSGFVTEGTTVDFAPGAVHNISFATTDSSWLPDISSSDAAGLNLIIVGRVRVNGGISGNGLTIAGDTLITSAPLSGAPSGLSVTLAKYEGPVVSQFENVSDWTVGTTQFTGGGGLPFNFDFTFDTLIVSGPVHGQLSQLLTANYVEVTGPGNPRHVGDTIGELTLSGGDGNTTLNVSGDVVVRGAGAHISSFAGVLSATGDFTVDQDAYFYSNGSFGGGSWSIGGDVLIDGTVTKDSLVKGHLSIGGDFKQLGTTAGESFAPDSSFVTEFTGVGIHQVSFQTPGDNSVAGHSYFGSLAVGSDSMVIQMQGDYYVEGTLMTAGLGNLTTFENTSPTLGRLNVQDVNIQDVTFDHLQFRIQKHSDPAAGTGNIDGLTFTNFLNTEDQFVVILPGLSTQFDWFNVNFSQLSTAAADPGHYVVATDWDGTPGNGGGPDTLKLSIQTNNAQFIEFNNYYIGLNGAVVSPFSP